MEEGSAIPLASCVAVGRFNPAILTPAWMVKEGILPDDEAEIGQMMGGGTLQFRLAGYMWQPSLSKLEVHAEGANLDPGEFVSQVLNRLPHTPLRGVGNNFALALGGTPGKQLYPLIQCPLVKLLATEEHENLALSATLALSHEKEAIIRVTLDADQEEVVGLSFNFHRDCTSASAGAEAARKWTADREEARRLLEKILP